jgi:hypothetical protein
MGTEPQRARGESAEVVHHYVDGDGAGAIAALLKGCRGRANGRVEERQYDNLRLQDKSRILRDDAPDV